ncbi:MAG: PHP domain-containing protein [Candidatus Heimdallarchaeota archaeon]|nr:PHP domain-containing protein [Candidatus Heimdallarchaeota archaeon]MCG3257931.1 PHP domain-containing protein [Candidatus Heimdallarchaeota archaeon]MCK4612982.1 PHP domain-containing protein [Candidatus Heimdallarchaeota archaeon]
MNWKYWKKLALRFLIFNLILWSLLGISIALTFDTPGYHKYSDSDWDDFSYSPNYNKTEWNILLDGHSHTYYSDGSLSPRQNILWHIAMGFNAMVLTDHNTFDGIEEIREIARQEFNDTIKVLIGMEWTTDRCHLNVILPPNTTAEDYEALLTFSAYTYTPTDLEIQEIIINTHNLGGIIQINHIPWSMDYCRNHPTSEQFRDWGIDYIEIINYDTFDNESYYFCLDNGLGMITGTDMHRPEPVYSYTTLNASEFSEQAIFDELKAKRTGFLFNGIPSPYTVEHATNPAYILAYPLIQFGEMFEGMYSSESFGPMLVVFFLYIYGAYILLETSKFLIPYSIKKIKSRKT